MNTRCNIPSPSTAHTRPRNGRALIECIVSALLLSVTLLALTATAKSVLALSDDSTLITRAQTLATTRVENAQWTGCTSNASGTDALPRVGLLWTQNSSGLVATMHVDATLNRSPIASNATTPMQFAIEAGTICP